MADNLLDYISSLHDEGLNDEQIFRLAQIWKKENPQPEVEEVEEVVETSGPQQKFFTTIDYSQLNLSNSFNPIDISLSSIQDRVNFTERQLLKNQKEQEGEQVELEEIELVANNPYNPVEMGEHLGLDVWTNINDKYDTSGLKKLGEWAKNNNTYTQDLGGPNENTYDLNEPIVLGGNEVAIDDYLNDQLKQPAHWAMGEDRNNQTTWMFTNDPTAQQKIKNKYFNGLGEDEKGYGPDIFKGIAPVNLPDLQGRRIFAGMQEVKDQWNWDYDQIFNWGERYLDEDELEFKNLNTLASKIKEEDADIDSLIPQIEDIISKYEPPAEIDRGAKNEALEEFKSLVKQARETKDYSKVIEYIAKKENYGTKLYDTTTGEVIGIDKATTKDLENYEKSEELAITTEYEDLELGLESQYYKLLTLAKDVRELNNTFGQGRTGFTGMDSASSLIPGVVPGIIRDEDNNIVGYTDDFYTSQSGIYSPDEYQRLMESHPDWNTGDIDFTYPVGNLRSQNGLLPKGLIEKITEFINTGEIPAGLKEIPSSHPLAAAYNQALNGYVVFNQAMQLNRNPIFMKSSIEAAEVVDEAMNMFGDNIVTTNERKNLFADALNDIGFDVSPEEITDQLDKGFGNKVSRGLVVFGGFLAELGLTRKVTPVSGQRATKLFQDIGARSGIYARSPWAKTAIDLTAKSIGEAADFAMTTKLYGEDGESALDSALFGASMPFGQAIFKGFSTFLNTRYIAGYTPIMQRLMKDPTLSKVITRTGEAQAGAFSYQTGSAFSSFVLDTGNYLESLEAEGSNLFEKHVEETLKMMIMGRVGKGVKGMENISYSLQNSFVRLNNKGRLNKDSRDAAKSLGIDNNIIKNPKADSYEKVIDAQTKALEELKKKKESMGSKEYEDAFNEILTNTQRLKNQLALNEVSDIIKENRKKPDGKLITDDQLFIISNKIKAGSKLTETESDILGQPGTPTRLVAERLGIEPGSPAYNTLKNYLLRNRYIQHQLNGGGAFYMENGVGFTAQGEFYTSNPKTRKEAYNFLMKREELNDQLRTLENQLKGEGLSESEKINIKSEIDALKLEVFRYSKGGTTYEALQSKIKKENLEVLTEELAMEYDLPGGKTTPKTSKQDFQDSFNKWVEAGEVKAQNVKEEVAVVNPKTGEAFINLEVATKIKDFTSKNHEDIHKFLLYSLKDNNNKVTDEGIKLIDDTLSQLSDNQRAVLDAEVSSRYDTKRPQNEWYEENLSVLSELIKSKRITFTEELGEKLKGFVPFLKQKGLENVDPENVTGKQMFDMIKGFAEGKENAAIQVEQFARDAAKLRGEEVSAVPVETTRSAKKNANELVLEFKENNPTINSQTNIPKNLLDQMFTMTADAWKFDVKKGTKTQQEFESEAQLYFTGILRRFNPDRGVKFSDFFYANIKPKAQKFYQTLEKETITDSADQRREQGKEVVETEEMVLTEERPTDTEGLAKTPTSTTIYKPEALGTLGIAQEVIDQKRGEGKSDNEIINEHITEVIERNFEGIDISKFKDAKVPKEIAELYANMFGIETVTGLTEKARNFPKKDEQALIRLRQFLVDNSAADFARLPKTVDMLGRGTGVYQNKFGKAMYDAEGNLVGTLKDYRDILQGKNVTVNGIEFNAVGKNGKRKPIYRGDLQASIKFATDMHMRNNILERTSTQGERLQMGGRFSKPKEETVTAEEIIETPYGSLAASKKTFETSFNEYLAEKGLPPLPTDSKERVKMYRDLTLNQLVDKFGDLTPQVIKWLGYGGMRVPTRKSGTGGLMVGVSRQLQDVVNKYGLYKNENDPESGYTKEVEDYIKANREGSILELELLGQEVSQEIIDRKITEARIEGYENKINPETNKKYTREQAEEAVAEESRKMALALQTQTLGKLEKNKREYEDIQAGKELIFDKFREIYKENPDKLGALISMIYTGNATNHPFRGFATVLGAEKGIKPGDKFQREEHVFQYGNFADAFTKAISGSDKVYEGFKEWAKEKYFQIKVSKETKDIIDQGVITTNRYTGETIEGYGPSDGLHPKFEARLKEALETGDFSKVPDPRYRYYNEYLTANPNKIGREYYNETTKKWEYRTDAEDYNVAVKPKFKDNAIVISEQGRLIQRVIESESGILNEDSPLFLTRTQAKEQMDAFMLLEPSVKASLSKQKNQYVGGKSPNLDTVEGLVYHLAQTDAAARNARKLNKEKKSLTAFDADETLVVTKSKVKVEMPDGTKFELDPNEFGAQAKELESQGAKFNFDDFMTIKGGEEGPAFKRYLEQYKQHGGENMFVLSARPKEFAAPMQAWLKSKGIDIPVENIIGLGNGTPAAKANWFINKGAEGYNDFLFADDILPNVKAVQGVIDVLQIDGPVQARLSSKPKEFNEIFNQNLELRTTELGSKVGADWQISEARAQTMGRRKNMNMFENFFMSYSAEDFNGLLYATLPKGKAGENMFQFYQENLIDPFNLAERKIESAKIAASADFKELKSRLTNLPKSMNKETGIGGFSFGDAARVAIWTEQGMEIPGLSKRDAKELNKFVRDNSDLSIFVQEVIKMQKGKQYPKPDKNWIAGTLTTDIMGEINKVNRAEYLQEWQENVDIIFSPENKRKLRYAFGDKYVEALDDMLRRMKSGNNKPIGGSRTVNNMLDWVNGSVGATMFLNTRSAALQTISAVNYLNWGDNNPYAAGKAFANQKQYWKDFTTLFNSDYLVNRREGLQINVTESEIADAAKKDGAKGAIAYLLNKGFVLTRGADSFAIASGGATFYRNRINTYEKQGMSTEEAQRKAFDDFRKISEENQQSSSPMRISQQQASGGGRLILAFKNTPMQYARIIKRSTQDLIAGRGDWKTNVSKIAYYGAAQNLIFNGLQNAIWTEAFDEDGDGTEKGARTANGMVDSLLGGLGYQGSVAVAIKNSLITIAKESGKDSPEFRKAVNDLLDFSPPIDVKARKLISAANTFSWERQAMKEERFNLNNPAYLATAQVVSAATNIPADRALQKINNTRMILSDNSEKWQKIALALGWSTWDVGLPYYGVPSTEPLSPEREMENREIEMRQNTSTKEQKQLLKELGLTNKEIRELRYEKDRVKKIIALQDKKKKDEEKTKTGGR
jgi:hypothetical protein